MDAEIANHPGFRDLHAEIDRLIREERVANKVTYNEKLPYQRYDRIGLEGLRWTPEKRISEAGIDKLVRPGCTVLDIGCNTGFIGIELAYAHKVARTDGIEPNAWLCRIGEKVADFLGVRSRVRFFDQMFQDFEGGRDYDLILSLAAFHTQDGREREGARDYFDRCLDLLKPGGLILYESVSYNAEEKGTGFLKAKEALSAMQQRFTTLESATRPSGSAGWFRDYFTGRKG